MTISGVETELHSESPPSLRVALPGLILAYGAGTLVSQVLILRELLVLAQGQELKLALGLWCWLLWTGLGSFLGGRLSSRAPALPFRLGGLLALLGLLLPATLLLCRALPSLAPLPWGQSLPPGLALLLFLALLAPFGAVSGYFFPCACRELAVFYRQGAIGRVYCLETLGAALGVLMLQLLLLGHYSNLALGLGTGLVLTVSAWGLARPMAPATQGAAFLGVLLLGMALIFLPRVENLSRAWQWPGRQVVATVDSPYAALVVTREAEQLSFFANQVWHFTYPDPLTAENQVQLALLEHPRPCRVLLLGGGVGGLVPEILKTATVTHLDYVELDPQLVQLGQRLLPAAAGLGPDPRVRLIFQDARRFLAAASSRYDVILTALPEPRSAQLNRYYSLEFFQIVRRHLEPGGLFSFSLAGAETSLHPLRAGYLALAYHTLRQVFSEVLVFPGERVRFFAGSDTGGLLRHPEKLVRRLKERHLDLQYVREYYLLQDLSPARQEYVRGLLSRQPAEVNTDLNPRCYFYDLTLSSIQEGLPLKEALLYLSRLPVFIPWAALALLILGLGLSLRRRPGPLYLYQVLVMGLGTMALEIMVLVLYQIQFGHLYREMGLLIAAFMVGMAAGGAAGTRMANRPGPARLLAALQMGLAALALGLAWWLPGVSGIPGGWLQAGYLMVLAAAGFGGGGVFALSAALLSRARPESASTGGLLYAVDLLGATLGTLGVSLLVLPVWGILPVLYLVAALHAGAGMMLVSPSPRPG